MKTYRLFTPAPIETRPLVAANLPVPEPGAGQVRIRVSVCGVCHTDLHTVEGEIHPPRLPVTPGHQVVGVVEAISPSPPAPLSQGEREAIHTISPSPDFGRGVGVRVGVPWLHSACGTCAFCLCGEENLCPKAQFTGFSVDGGYAEYMLADARYVLPLPDGISDEQAAPLLCAGIVGYRALKKAEIRPGERVGLFGFGASAHLCLQVLRGWGCEVWVFTRSKFHQEHARELGAAWAGASTPLSTGEIPLNGETGSGSGFLDRAVVFAPAGEIALRALEAVRPGGTVAMNAIHMSDIPSFPYQKIYCERTLRSVANATYADGVEFLALAAQMGLRSTVKPYALADCNSALDDLKHSRFNGEAVLKVSGV